jgi:adenylate cyclase
MLRRVPIILAATILCLILLPIAMRLRQRPGAPAAGKQTTLAVLPFENLTGDAGQNYFSDGLTEEIIIQLGRSDPQRLQVISSTSAVGYKAGRDHPELTGKRLGAQYLLEGTVRRDSNKVRISAKLVKANSRSYLWAKQYDRELTDLLSLQSEIAQNIAGEVRLTLGGNRPRA